jgi:choline dehydrogenase
VRRILDTPPLAELRQAERYPGPQARSDDELLRFIRAAGQPVDHPVGTSKMGNDPLAVVDERLCVRGLQSVRVVDASIMPSIIGSTTNAPTIMIAEKAADMFKQDNG